MMKTAAYKFLLGIFVFTGYAGQVTTGQSLPDSLTVYLEIAARNNPQVQKKLLEYQAALERVPQVKSLPDPELSAGILLKPMELIGGNQVADLRLMQMFPWFGVLKNAGDEMSLMAKSKFELFRDTKAQIYYDVQLSWFRLFKIRQESRIAEKNIEILRTIERLSLVKFRAPDQGNNGSAPSGSMSSSVNNGSDAGSASGMTNMTVDKSSQGGSSLNNRETMPSTAIGMPASGTGLADLFRIKIEINELEYNIESLKNQETAERSRFNFLLNRDLLTNVYVDSSLTFDPAEISQFLASDSIPANNPMLNMLDLEIQSLGARKKMVTGMGFPMLGVGMNYTLINKNPMSASSMNGADMLMPMISVTLPVYRKKYNSMKSETDLLRSAAEQEYKSTLNLLNSELQSALESYRDALLRSRLYEDQHTLVSGTLSVSLRDFSTSTLSLTEILRLQKQAIEFELKQVESTVDLNRAAAWIKRLMASETVN